MTWARKSYYDIVMETGFPTMGGHRIIMGYLKFQSWYYFLKDFEMMDIASLISGVRKKRINDEKQSKILFKDSNRH